MAGTIFRIKVTGDKDAAKLLNKLQNTQSDRILEQELNKTILKGLNYWETNVYRAPFFNARRSMGKPVSGQLGKGAKITVHPNGFVNVSLKKLVSKDGRDYGTFLRKGIGPSPNGAYYPPYDCKVNSLNQPVVPGYKSNHPGFTNARWLLWVKHFKEFMGKEYERAVVRTIKRIVREK